jgi:dTDP-4-dehydrorhamnose reductase
MNYQRGMPTRAKSIQSISEKNNNVKSNILITGSNGQLGSELKVLNDEFLMLNYKCYFTNKDSLDITNFDKVREFCKINNIKIIINAAAYTAVDKAEDDKENANNINHLAVKNLATISKELNISLVHISTDYVFDGNTYLPYKEDDTANPNGIYGQTKLDGEKAIREVNPASSVIIRTSWVYSSFGNNFVKTMLNLSKKLDTLGVIYDQIGTPTNAADLAKAILNILPKIKNDKTATYHYSNEGVISWYDFSKAIFELSNIDIKINPIQTKDYPTKAIRPHYSVLDKTKIKKDFDIMIPYWKDSLKECLEIIDG